MIRQYTLLLLLIAAAGCDGKATVDTGSPTSLVVKLRSPKVGDTLTFKYGATTITKTVSKQGEKVVNDTKTEYYAGETEEMTFVECSESSVIKAKVKVIENSARRITTVNGKKDDAKRKTSPTEGKTYTAEMGDKGYVFKDSAGKVSEEAAGLGMHVLDTVFSTPLPVREIKVGETITLDKTKNWGFLDVRFFEMGKIGTTESATLTMTLKKKIGAVGIFDYKVEVVEIAKGSNMKSTTKGEGTANIGPKGLPWFMTQKLTMTQSVTGGPISTNIETTISSERRFTHKFAK